MQSQQLAALTMTSFIVAEVCSKGGSWLIMEKIKRFRRESSIPGLYQVVCREQQRSSITVMAIGRIGREVSRRLKEAWASCMSKLHWGRIVILRPPSCRVKRTKSYLSLYQMRTKRWDLMTISLTRLQARSTRVAAMVLHPLLNSDRFPVV